MRYGIDIIEFVFVVHHAVYQGERNRCQHCHARRRYWCSCIGRFELYYLRCEGCRWPEVRTHDPLLVGSRSVASFWVCPCWILSSQGESEGEKTGPIAKAIKIQQTDNKGNLCLFILPLLEQFHVFLLVLLSSVLVCVVFRGCHVLSPSSHGW